MTRGRWLSVCVLAMTACSDPEILGETTCSPDSAGCIPVHYEVGSAGAKDVANAYFDIEAQETRRTSWTAVLPIANERARDGRWTLGVEPAPDGGTWVAWLNDATYRLMRLDAAGREVAAHAVSTPPVFGPLDNYLTASPTLQPVVEWREGGRDANARSPLAGTAYVLDDNAGLTAVAAPSGLTPLRTLRGPANTLRRVTANRDRSLSLHEHRDTGELSWTRPIDLGPRSAFYDASRSGETPLLAVTASGSTLLVWPVVEKKSPEFSTKILTLVDPQGNVKWHMEFTRRDSFAITLAPLATGGLAIATSGPDGFHLFTLDDDANLKANWYGLPVAHYRETPQKLASDAEGNLYFAVSTGPRRAAQLTVCKLRANDDGVPPHCIDVEGVSAAALDITSIASPSPNSVVVGYGTSAQPLSGPFSWAVSRVDF